MKNRKVFSLLLAGVLTLSIGTGVCAATEDEIAAAQAQKQAAQAELAQAEANISSLETKKQELENYLAELDSQYSQLTDSVAQLGIEAAQKEEELKKIEEELGKARKQAEKQYDAMKLRIAYMYEKGGSSMLELLLSSKSIAEFLNQAENVSRISQYDRDMLKKYEEIRNSIKEQESQVEEETASINTLLSERVAKQQEVQAMVASTNDSIYSYVGQISASEEEAGILMAQIDSADSSIAELIQQQEAAQAAAQQEAASAEAEAASDESGQEIQAAEAYDPETDTMESSSSSTSSDIIVEEEDESELLESTENQEEDVQESYEEQTYEASGETESTSSDSGQGTYLGNFTLTAYCNCAQCCGTAGNATASGTMPSAGRTVAMAGVPFGTQLLINGNVYTVEDLGTPYGHVDIYFDSHEEALSFGLQYADVYQLN